MESVLTLTYTEIDSLAHAMHQVSKGELRVGANGLSRAINKRRAARSVEELGSIIENTEIPPELLSGEDMIMGLKSASFDCRVTDGKKRFMDNVISVALNNYEYEGSSDAYSAEEIGYLQAIRIALKYGDR